MKTLDLLKSILDDYRADVVSPPRYLERGKSLMLNSFKRSATDEIYRYVKMTDPFDPVGSIEMFIGEMAMNAVDYPKSSDMFLVYKYTAEDILDILRNAI